MELYALSRILMYSSKSEGDVVVVAGACHTSVYAKFFEDYLRLVPLVKQYVFNVARGREKKTCVGPKSPHKMYDSYPAKFAANCVW